jgi:hypothetical protein
MVRVIVAIHEAKQGLTRSKSLDLRRVVDGRLRRDRIESDHPFRADDEETVVKLIPVLVDAIGYNGD